MAKPSNRRRGPRKGKTRRHKRSRDRREQAQWRAPAPGYLFSLQDFNQAQAGLYLPALLTASPEEEILAQLPPPRRGTRGRGRKPYARRALLRALVARLAWGIKSYDQLAARLEQDVVLKHHCGFEMGRSTPDSSTLEKFAQFLGEHLHALQSGH